MKLLRTILPALISAVLILIIVRLAPWDQVWLIVRNIDAESLVLLLIASLAYYGIKILRYGYILRELKVRLPFWRVAQLYLAAQPVSLLPGGELYRVRMVHVHETVPTSQILPIFTTQGILEALALATVAAIASLQLQLGRLTAAGLLIVVGAAVVAVRFGGFRSLLSGFNRLPLVNISRAKIEYFSKNSQELLKGSAFFTLVALSLLAEAIGVAIAYISVVAVGGSISLPEAALLYVLPIVIGFISFLPGGLGASEQVGIGWLLLLDLGAALSVTATLLMRVSIVATGIAYGLMANGWLALSNRRVKV